MTGTSQASDAGRPQPRTSGEAVRRATGRDRESWFALLDAWGAVNRPHREIAAWLSGEHAMDGWWAQSLTVDYEQARGLRPPGGARDGTFEVSASRTVRVPVERLFAAWVEPELRERWLPGRELRERTSQPWRTARFDCDDGRTRVVVGFDAIGEDRSRASIAHQRLPDAVSAEEARAFWRERMDALKAMLEGG
jgi:Domain of unknown function (DUF4287)